MTTLYDFSAHRLGGVEEKLSAYEGKVVLVVNVASKCGLTPQYEGLEKLWRDYQDRGFVVLGFPCNQFAGQEPGTADEISSFCSLTYDVTFPMFDKVDVNGGNSHPLFKWLRKAAPDLLGMIGLGDVKWNFTKFLIDRNGNAVRRFDPTTDPAAIAPEIEKLL